MKPRNAPAKAGETGVEISVAVVEISGVVEISVVGIAVEISVAGTGVEIVAATGGWVVPGEIVPLETGMMTKASCHKR